MIVAMRTRAQAARVAASTSGRQLLNEDGSPTNKVWIDDFEAHRHEIEAVSELFTLASDDGEVVPSGWVLRGTQFEVEWPSEPERRALSWSHFGARRFAKNWAIGQVRADLEARQANPNHVSIPWTLETLRKRWNQVKHELAPWWAENSKECYSAGIAHAVQALQDWSASKHGKRKGRRVGLLRFESKRRTKNRVRFTTGAMRLEPDRRHLTLPVIGTLRSKENTRRVQRHVENGHARVLSMTLSERWGRLFVSIQYAVRTRVVSPTGRTPAKPDARAGVDLGLRVLATIADTDGNVVEVPSPAPLEATITERRRVGRALSRRIRASRGYRRAKAKLARLDRRAVCLRREIYHQLARWLVDTDSEVVIEDLDLVGMQRSMGRRAFRRSVGDAALGMFRPTSAYKAEYAGVQVIVADRWYGSSKTHHGCGGRLADPKLAKQLTCESCGAVDRDENAAKNLRNWPKTHASPGAVGASARSTPGRLRALQTRVRWPGDRPPGEAAEVLDLVEAAAGEARTEACFRQAEEPREGCIWVRSLKLTSMQRCDVDDQPRVRARHPRGTAGRRR